MIKRLLTNEERGRLRTYLAHIGPGVELAAWMCEDFVILSDALLESAPDDIGAHALAAVANLSLRIARSNKGI